MVYPYMLSFSHMPEGESLGKKILRAIGIGTIAGSVGAIQDNPTLQHVPEPTAQVRENTQPPKPELVQSIVIDTVLNKLKSKQIDIQEFKPRPQVVPSNSEIKQVKEIRVLYDYPDQNKGRQRFVDEKAETYFPSTTGALKFNLPPGRNAFILERTADVRGYPNPIRQKWIFFDVEGNEKITWTDQRGVSIQSEGPLAFLLDFENPADQENPMVQATVEPSK